MAVSKVNTNLLYIYVNSDVTDTNSGSVECTS